MFKEILKNLHRQINKMKVKGILTIEEASPEDLRNYIILFKQLDIARNYEKEILKIKYKYEGFLEAEKKMYDWYEEQIIELESEYNRTDAEQLFEKQSTNNNIIKNRPSEGNRNKNLDKNNNEIYKVKARDHVLVNLRESEKQVWELHTDGYTVQKIANKLNKHKQSISATIINIKNKVSRKQNLLRNIDL